LFSVGPFPFEGFIDALGSDSVAVTGIPQNDHVHLLAVAKEIPYIVKGADMVAEAFKNGGRLIYVGAGTSGRLGVLDASECPPTFGSDPEMVQGLIAGGYKALIRAHEGSEDEKEQGIYDLREKQITSKDVICGIAASHRTPYVIGALEEAKKLGAKTLLVICNPRKVVKIDVDVAICPVLGPEVILGSTRLKAGSAQKMILNILTTAAMIKLGKVYDNMMIDLQLNSQKLVERSKKIIMLATDKSYEDASFFLTKSNGHVKSAILMAITGMSLARAKVLLDTNEGFIKKALIKHRDEQNRATT